MNQPLLAGLLVAWALAQLALAAYFGVAYVLRRRESEYLAFALLCCTLAVATAGIAGIHAATSPHQWLVAAEIGTFGSVLAVPTNLDFVCRFSARPVPRWLRPAAYALAAVFASTLVAGMWWQPESVSVDEYVVFGVPVERVSARPSVLSSAFYPLAIASLVASVWILVRALRAGNREVRAVIGGAVLIVVVATNDAMVVSGMLRSVYLLPNGFMVYAFTVAATLLLRYRAAAGELEATATDLAARTRELQSSYVELQSLEAQLIEKRQLAAVGELAAAIAHEVRNPLAIISNAVANVRRPGLRDADRETMLGIVEEEVARLESLVTDLLRYARPVALERTTIAVADVARQAAEARGGAVRVVVDEQLRDAIEADHGQLRVALDNVLDNALEAGSAEPAVVEISEGRLDGAAAVRVRVRDRGAGMSREVLERALDPFYTTRPSGTGLGLPIVRRIVEAHGGRVELESQLGEGTAVTLVLPRVRPATSTIPPGRSE